MVDVCVTIVVLLSLLVLGNFLLGHWMFTTANTQLAMPRKTSDKSVAGAFTDVSQKQHFRLKYSKYLNGMRTEWVKACNSCRLEHRWQTAYAMFPFSIVLIDKSLHKCLP